MRTGLVAVGFGDLSPEEGHDMYDLYAILEGHLHAEQADARKARLENWRSKHLPENDPTLAAACRYVADRKQNPLYGLLIDGEYVIELDKVDQCLQKEWTAVSDPPWDLWIHQRGCQVMIDA